MSIEVTAVHEPVESLNNTAALSFSLVIPTYNAGPLFERFISRIQQSVIQPEKILVIDSSSNDGTAELARKAGFTLVSIPQSEFDHGGTRNVALSYIKTDLVVFMTQDAILQTPYTLVSLLHAFTKDRVAAAYGRQLPHYDAKPLGAFARFHNYPEQPYLTELKADFPTGIRKAFMSNSFAAYRSTRLKEVGGFPEKLILGEDAFVAGKLLLAGDQIHYVSESCVHHSHNYSLKEELKRYFDIGVFHQDQHWLLETFGAPEKAGIQFALKQTRFLIEKKKSYLIPYSGFSLVAKYIGYRLGRAYQAMPKTWPKHLSMHKKYWQDKSAAKAKS